MHHDVGLLDALLVKGLGGLLHVLDALAKRVLRQRPQPSTQHVAAQELHMHNIAAYAVYGCWLAGHRDPQELSAT